MKLCKVIELNCKYLNLYYKKSVQVNKIKFVIRGFWFMEEKENEITGIKMLTNTNLYILNDLSSVVLVNFIYLCTSSINSFEHVSVVLKWNFLLKGCFLQFYLLFIFSHFHTTVDRENQNSSFYLFCTDQTLMFRILCTRNFMIFPSIFLTFFSLNRAQNTSSLNITTLYSLIYLERLWFVKCH